MLICISSQGPDLDSQVDPRFGRAAQFIIADTETGEAKAVDNKQNLQAAQGAGIQAAMTVANAGAKALLTGHCGPKAYVTLNKAGIEVYTGCNGTVAQAIEDYKAGKLQKAAGADVEGHW
ncbi:Predicted Fe-Mo cluster-binding protein, NifX family [Desulfatibacillum alkenivorans DSM 16219]|jgi:predicted Fe-Mo cluster-binding NifX family protein|uniref:Predicted Fe-Mo cluster-binding protein, NifX family n=1 Tax=Desulfatibacillum alkenivorans DSM 16219 TaxID=1121393 RepID=A0A1M6XIA2_9BACT|nr:NifB/NifX family molybdenum-iron cluster-binding protein [Desulfatibacillum alkenivorans]SHL05579.1 Predicted Fe-Mo cluster-binding protein, NifX family [Desulfatibacillum alkenivorans DSM 16219]